jgi:hypothetical protein
VHMLTQRQPSRAFAVRAGSGSRLSIQTRPRRNISRVPCAYRPPFVDSGRRLNIGKSCGSKVLADLLPCAEAATGNHRGF